MECRGRSLLLICVTLHLKQTGIYFDEDFPPKVYFNGFNDWNLNIMVIAWYHPAAYWDYQAWLQRTCLEIMKRFSEEEIKFAFPSQTIYMTNDEERAVAEKYVTC